MKPDTRTKQEKIQAMFDFLSENSRSEYMENFIEGYFAMEEQIVQLKVDVETQRIGRLNAERIGINYQKAYMLLKSGLIIPESKE